MKAEERELLAGLRILVCVARADGVLHETECDALNRALLRIRGATSSPDFPKDVNDLLADDFSLEAEKEFLRHDDARRQVYESAWVVANADGVVSPQERAMLERLRPHEHEESLLQQALGETLDTFHPSHIAPIYDPESRDDEIREDTLKYAVLCAGLGAMPLPGVSVLTDLAVVALQVKLVRDIGQYWGHKVDAQAARSLVVSGLGSVGLRVALNNLARLLPGWGSVFGAATSFASTMAVGRMANAYFASGGAASAEHLRETYEAGLAEGRKAYEAHSANVEAVKATHGERLTALHVDLVEGRIDHATYEREIAALRSS
jgi:uncharacterized protein (DUF697 family)/tellurite resistance protein